MSRKKITFNRGLYNALVSNYGEGVTLKEVHDKGYGKAYTSRGIGSGRLEMLNEAFKELGWEPWDLSQGKNGFSIYVE
jgi:capsular polysaccharide biosynthesis protein|tara:strand:+ start:2387 stop:2620 length:234 start_codon:yes stop_codon:yes gene_type:complete